MHSATETREQARGRATRLGLALLYFLLFLVAFLLGTRFIHAAVKRVPGVAFTEGTVERAKHVHFARHADDYDLVALGSSRIMRHFVPAVFDQRMQQFGHPVRSYNFGVAGMRFPEIEATVEFILEQEPARLRWAVIELQEIDQTFFRRNPFTQRTIHWHEREVTARLLRAVWASERDDFERLAQTKNHLHHLALRLSNVGTGVPLLAVLVGRKPLLALEDDLGDGFIPFRANHSPDFEDGEELMASYRRIYRQTPDDLEPHPHFRKNVQRLAARLRGAGIEPIFYLAPPVSDWRAPFLKATLNDPPTPLWPYHDPARYPQFCDPDNLYNRFHLNTRGARRLSIRMAKDFLRLAENVVPR